MLRLQPKREYTDTNYAKQTPSLSQFLTGNKGCGLVWITKGKSMPLIRGVHSFDHNFTQIPNEWLRDKRLSFKARGLLSLLLSHSQGWSLSIQSLVTDSKEGKDAIRSAIHELETFGYLERTQVNEKGRFGESVWETKDPAGLPIAGLPVAGFPTSANPPLKNTKDKKTNNKKNNNQELFDEFWKEYPRKRDKPAALKSFRSALSRAKFEDILAGAIRYKNDPTRNPDFTKYPATWLNADSWENDYQPADDSVKRSELRKQKEREESQRYIAEQKRLAEQAAPAPKCEHGKNKLLCKECLKVS